MDKEQLDLEIRLQAIEYVLIHIGKISLLGITNADGPAATYAARNLRRAVSEKLGDETFPGLHAVWSAHVAAEMQEAVDKLLAGIENVVAGTFRE